MYSEDVDSDQQDVDGNLDGARGRRSALAVADGDDQLMAEAMKKHEEQKAMFRAPSKHAPDSDIISRGRSTLPSTQGTVDVLGIGQTPSKPRICTDMASWAQYPSHTRADRCGSAGRADAMNAIDFADPSRLRVGAVTPTGREPAAITPVRRRPTNASTRSKKKRGLVKSTSQGLERVARYYSNLFATSNFRGNNRRTSVSASTGVLQHPELEMLAPATALDTHQHVHDHLKRVDEDLGMLSSAFRIPSFSVLGHHHRQSNEQDDESPNVGPDEEEVPSFATGSDPNASSGKAARKIDLNMSNLPFRKLSTFFLVEGKINKNRDNADDRGDDEVPVPPEEDEPPFGPVQFDGAANDTDTIDTLDAIEGAERKSG